MAYSSMTDPQTWSAGNKLTAAQLNTYLRDNQNAMFPIGDASDTWSPSSYSNVTIGNGTVVARYIRFGDHVYAYWHLVFGSTSSISGDVSVDLPVTPNSNYINAISPLGTVVMNDATGSRYFGVAFYDAANNGVLLRVGNASATYLTQSSLSATIPFTWTTSDTLAFMAVYETA